MKEKILKIYRGDIALIGTCIILIWVALIFVLIQVEGLINNIAASILLAAACFLSLFFLTGALVGVISHLKHNRTNLYTEDITHANKQ